MNIHDKAFLDWRYRNKDLEDKTLKSLKCSECDGMGGFECEECGSEIICPECDGTGEAEEDGKEIRIAMFELYKKRRNADEILLSRWKETT